jgi:membrane protease YdiL (CAAX protease family)
VEQSQELGFNPVGTVELILTFISLVILPPLVEELLMRGYLYTSLKKKLSKIAAALVTSVIFAAAHLQFGSGAPLLWVAAIDTFVLSLFLVSLREKTGGLWASMTLHATKNLIAFMSLFIFHIS